MIRVLSFPSRHPYTSKFHKKKGILFVNPNTDYFNKIGGEANPVFLDKKHKVKSYDVVHIHFSFDKLSYIELNNLINYFKKNKKPIVWTCHSRNSQRKKDIEKGKLQKLLFEKADRIITLTNGCKKWLIKNFGDYKDIKVIKLGYMLDPKTFFRYKHNLINKRKDNFVYLIGDFRENKEIKNSISAFLNEPKLSSCKLKLIMHTPIKKQRNKNFIHSISNNKQIEIIAKSVISNDLLNKIFCESHICLLPYLWGTHSGQIELCRDCGCYPIISDVGFYKEQYKKTVIFKKGKTSKSFKKNFLKALINTHKKNILKPYPKDRVSEFEKILAQHISLYKEII